MRPPLPVERSDIDYLVRQSRRWEIEDPRLPTMTLMVAERRLLGHLAGTIHVRGRRGSDPFNPIDIFEASGGRPAVTVQGRGVKLLLPPFCDFPASDLPPEAVYAATTIQFHAKEFFGRTLPWWVAIDGDEIVHGQIGVLDRRAEGHLEISYEAYLRARSGSTPWRNAVAEDGRVEGGAAELLALASVPGKLVPISAASLESTFLALAAARDLPATSCASTLPFEDPASLWPNTGPVRFLRLFLIEMVQGPMLTAVQMWTGDTEGGTVPYDLLTLPFDIAADVVELPIDGEPRLVWSGRTPFPIGAPPAS